MIIECPAALVEDDGEGTVGEEDMYYDYDTKTDSKRPWESDLKSKQRMERTHNKYLLQQQEVSDSSLCVDDLPVLKHSSSSKGRTIGQREVQHHRSAPELSIANNLGNSARNNLKQSKKEVTGSADKRMSSFADEGEGTASTKTESESDLSSDDSRGNRRDSVVAENKRADAGKERRTQRQERNPKQSSQTQLNEGLDMQYYNGHKSDSVIRYVMDGDEDIEDEGMAENRHSLKKRRNLSSQRRSRSTSRTRPTTVSSENSHHRRYRSPSHERPRRSRSSSRSRRRDRSVDKQPQQQSSLSRGRGSTPAEKSLGNHLAKHHDGVAVGPNSRRSRSASRSRCSSSQRSTATTTTTKSRRRTACPSKSVGRNSRPTPSRKVRFCEPGSHSSVSEKIRLASISPEQLELLRSFGLDIVEGSGDATGGNHRQEILDSRRNWYAQKKSPQQP